MLDAMTHSAFSKRRRLAYVRRERRGLMRASALVAVPIGLGLLALVGVAVVFGLLNLLLPWFVWLPAEKRVPATLGELAMTVGSCTAITIGLYYLLWSVFFIFVPDVRKPTGNHETGHAD
ncbi:MAG: hypothetical protein AAGB29_00335 [Planctomycetota bacterium]